MLNTNCPFENKILSDVNDVVTKGNIDNISRTQFYNKFYVRNPEIEWAFLASMVSRNAGWNMCDLQGKWFPGVLSENFRDLLYLTYEHANWYIFADAYPQLLLYEISKQEGTSYFHLLKKFHVSQFMQMEWEKFWQTKDRKRLIIAQIINEQNIIQKPVINQPFYKKKVFRSFSYLFQDWFHYSCVLFPTIEGELYGFSVHDFSNLNERINVGKKLAWLLFHPYYYRQFQLFSERTEHTGSRYDYEQYFWKRKERDTPYLRMVYPIIQHHRSDFHDWYRGTRQIEKWFKPIKTPKKFRITSWYRNKQSLLHAGIIIKNGVT